MQPQKQRPFWSARLKHSQIIINGSSIERHASELNNDVLILGNMTLLPGKKYKWSIQLANNNRWIIYFWIILEKRACNIGFDLEETSQQGIGGQYFINCNNGNPIVLKKECVIKRPSGPEDIFLNHGDVLDLVFNSEVGVLEINVRDQGNSWQFEVDPPPDGDCYRPCVSLWQNCQLKFLQCSEQ